MKRSRLLLIAVVVLIYAVLLAPLVVVIGVSFNTAATFDFPPKGLSLRWYVAFFQSPTFVRSFFQVSFVVALVASAIATVLGMLGAIGLVRFRFVGRRALETFFAMPLFVPQILLGAALYLYYSRLGIGASLLTLLLSHVVLATPYVIRNITAGLAGINPRLEEAATSLGANKVQAFTRVTLPLLRSSILSGAIFAFIVSFSDINLALFLSGPDTTSLPVHIFSQIQWESNPTIAAASALQIIIIGALLLIAQRVFQLRLVV
jgi:putative spermidine/putrescine transport system permease protein